MGMVTVTGAMEIFDLGVRRQKFGSIRKIGVLAQIAKTKTQLTHRRGICVLGVLD